MIPTGCWRPCTGPMPNIYEGELIDITDEVFERPARLARTTGTAVRHHRQRPRRLGDGDHATRCRGATRCSCSSPAGSRSPGARWPPYPASRSRCWTRPTGGRSTRPPSRTACAPTPSTEHQGRPRRAGRHRHVGAQRHRRHPPRHRRRRPPGAADGRLHRLARLRPLRDGRVGRRRHGRRLAEGADGAARPRLRLGGTARRGRRTSTAGLRTGYWDWTRPRRRTVRTTCATAARRPSPHLYGLREALAMIREEGLEAVWARHAVLARCGPRRGRGLGGARRARAPHRRSRGPVQRGHRRSAPGGIDAIGCAACARSTPASRSASASGRRATGLPHRPHGPPQPADAARHARHDRGGADRVGTPMGGSASPRPPPPRAGPSPPRAAQSPLPDCGHADYPHRQLHHHRPGVAGRLPRTVGPTLAGHDAKVRVSTQRRRRSRERPPGRGCRDGVPRRGGVPRWYDSPAYREVIDLRLKATSGFAVRGPGPALNGGWPGHRRRRLGRLRQAPLRRTGAGAEVPGPVHPPGGHQQPPADRPGGRPRSRSAGRITPTAGGRRR